MPSLVPIRNFYSKYEHQISSLFLIGGFILDVLTLKRADRLFENAFIVGYIVLIGIFILILHTEETDTERDGYSPRAHFWYLNILQFCFGGVLSANLVLYFRSSDFFTAWPFLIILAIAFWANESLREQQVRFSFQISLYFFGIYSFLIFFLPVMFHRIGPLMFILAGVLSLLLISFFVMLVFKVTKDNFKESKKLIFFIVAGIFIVINTLYFTNLIPPMPLALKDGEVFHNISKTAEGKYEVAYEDSSWINYLDLFPNFHRTAGEPVYAYSAVFSPAGLDLNIVHVWQYLDTVKKEWVDDQSVNLAVRGGRDGGFRTYSVSHNVKDGKWRVQVKTENGQEIGQIRFEVITVEQASERKSQLK